MKYVPCTCRSNGIAARKMPVMPPSVNEPDEADREQHRGGVVDLAAPQRRRPREDLDAGRDRRSRIVMIMNGSCNHGAMPDVNMWCAQTMKPSERDRHRREGDQLVAEDRLAREGRQHFGDDPERRQDHDVDGRVRVEPEHVLPQHRAAAFGRVEERHAELALDEERARARPPSAVVAIISSGAVANCPHTKSGMRVNVMPGARIFKIVTRKLMPVMRRADADQEDRQRTTSTCRPRLAARPADTPSSPPSGAPIRNEENSIKPGDREDPEAEHVQPRETRRRARRSAAARRGCRSRR